VRRAASPGLALWQQPLPRRHSLRAPAPPARLYTPSHTASASPPPHPAAPPPPPLPPPPPPTGPRHRHAGRRVGRRVGARRARRGAAAVAVAPRRALARAGQRARPAKIVGRQSQAAVRGEGRGRGRAARCAGAGHAPRGPRSALRPPRLPSARTGQVRRNGPAQAARDGHRARARDTARARAFTAVGRAFRARPPRRAPTPPPPARRP